MIIISFFPNGITWDDLDIMEHLGMVKEGWKEHLFKLLKKDIKFPIKEEDIECGDFFYLEIKEVQLKKDLKIKLFKSEFFNGVDDEELKMANINDL